MESSLSNKVHGSVIVDCIDRVGASDIMTSDPVAEQPSKQYKLTDVIPDAHIINALFSIQRFRIGVFLA